MVAPDRVADGSEAGGHLRPAKTSVGVGGTLSGERLHVAYTTS
jgi:hypothetical protein